ncbi:MAG: hypothetical protein AB7E80_10650 [Hyphomicrobiaceae bacterium]
MDDFINHVNNLSPPALVACAMLVAAGGYVLFLIVDSKILTTIFMAFFMAGALIVEYLAAKYHVVLFQDDETNLLFLTTVGMIWGLGMAIMLMRVSGAAADVVKPRTARPLVSPEP